MCWKRHQGFKILFHSLKLRIKPKYQITRRKIKKLFELKQNIWFSQSFFYMFLLLLLYLKRIKQIFHKIIEP